MIYNLKKGWKCKYCQIAQATDVKEIGYRHSKHN